ncbi:MAG: dUTP diphosphatase [Candidatus Diapherotrites archaeon]|nr:dUTP diphosphatase [Candidatus Diapherotrites archaeon]
MNTADLKVFIRKVNEQAILPQYAHESDAGMDLYACEETVILPGQWKMVSTGISIEMPHGLEAQVRPRSGLAAKHGLSVLNTPGTIDPDYRGEIKVILINFGSQEYKVEFGHKIAQMVFNKIEKPKIETVDQLSETQRGEKGFGSTGK